MLEKIIKWFFAIFLAITVPIIGFITLNDCFLFEGDTIDKVSWLIIFFVLFLVFEFSLLTYFKSKDKGSGCALQTLIVLVAIIFSFKYFFWQTRGILAVVGIFTLLCLPFLYLNSLIKNEEKHNDLMFNYISRHELRKELIKIIENIKNYDPSKYRIEAVEYLTQIKEKLLDIYYPMSLTIKRMKKKFKTDGPFDEKLIKDWHKHWQDEDEEIKKFRGPIKWHNKNNDNNT